MLNRVAASMRRGFTPRSLKSASCRRRTRFSASIDRRGLVVRTRKPIKSAIRRRIIRGSAITPTPCHGFHSHTQPKSCDRVFAEDSRASGGDRRLKSVWLTREGEKLLSKLKPLALQHEARLAAGFTPKEREQLLTMLGRLSENCGTPTRSPN